MNACIYDPGKYASSELRKQGFSFHIWTKIKTQMCR